MRVENSHPVRPLQSTADAEGSNSSMHHEWYYVDDATKTQHGPCSVKELGKLSATRRVTGSTLVWRHGMESWSPLSLLLPLHAQVALEPHPEITEGRGGRCTMAQANKAVQCTLGEFFFLLFFHV